VHPEACLERLHSVGLQWVHARQAVLDTVDCPLDMGGTNMLKGGQFMLKRTGHLTVPEAAR